MRIRARLGTGAPEAQERLTHLVETLNQGIALKRRIIEDLHPSSLTNLGLASALEILAREFGERAGILVECTAQPVSLASADRLTAYRLVQEGLTNARKHSNASQTDVRLCYEPGCLEIEVSDNGRGATTTDQGGHGLAGMRERVTIYNGEFEAGPRPGGGFRLRARLPVPQ